VREAYGFLCNNYEEGDEIILLGFSRGAFTARSIGALISQVGLLTYEGMENFYTIFSDWEQQDLGQTFTFHDEKNLNWLPRTGDVKSSYTRCLEEVSTCSIMVDFSQFNTRRKTSPDRTSSSKPLHASTL